MRAGLLNKLRKTSETSVPKVALNKATVHEVVQNGSFFPRF
jgi:hypothetical protein